MGAQSFRTNEGLSFREQRLLRAHRFPDKHTERLTSPGLLGQQQQKERQSERTPEQEALFAQWLRVEEE